MNDQNDDSARDAELFFERLYAELRAIAANNLKGLPAGQTLQPTEIVHEAYSRMKGKGSWESDKHFLNTAAQAMRQLLVDRARRRMTVKRGGDRRKEEFNELENRIVVKESDERLLAVNESLFELSKVDSRAAKLVELTFFLGLPQAQAANTLGISERTARRDLLYARAYLSDALGES